VALAVAAVLLAIPAASPVRADTTAQLLAQRAALLEQLAALTPARDAAAGALSQAEAAYNQETSQLRQAQANLASLNHQLESLAAAISADTTQAQSAKAALATLTRATYESASSDTTVTAVLNASDFSAAMNSLSGASKVSSEIEGLEISLSRDERDLYTKQAALQGQEAQASALENQISQADDQFLATVVTRDQIMAQLDGPARQIAIEIAQIDNQLSGNVVPASGSCRNTFAYGECTWYVATKRCIPWGGNADAWFYNAARMGYKEGHVPEVGAVTVWYPGRGGASYYGHVAYVEAVGPTSSIPAGSFEVSEMNWSCGWDCVDYRVVQNDPNIIQGFIYGP
jgi:surface antigen